MTKQLKTSKNNISFKEIIILFLYYFGILFASWWQYIWWFSSVTKWVLSKYQLILPVLHVLVQVLAYLTRIPAHCVSSEIASCQILISALTFDKSSTFFFRFISRQTHVSILVHSNTYQSIFFLLYNQIPHTHPFFFFLGWYVRCCTEIQRYFNLRKKSTP